MTATQSFREDNEAIKAEARRHGVRVTVLVGAMRAAWEGIDHDLQRKLIWDTQQRAFAEAKRIEAECRNPTEGNGSGPGRGNRAAG